MQITIKKNNSKKTGWVDFEVKTKSATLRGQALIFGEPSHYGINGGRVSKLWLRDTARMHTAFNYDRGDDVNELDPATVAGIVEFLEANV